MLVQLHGQESRSSYSSEQSAGDACRVSQQETGARVDGLALTEPLGARMERFTRSRPEGEALPAGQGTNAAGGEALRSFMVNNVAEDQATTSSTHSLYLPLAIGT